MAGVPPRDGAAAPAGALGRLRDDADQRAQSLRHRRLARAGLGAGRRERDRARDVEDFLRRRQQLRPRLGDRGFPLHPRDPDPPAQRPQHPERDMTTATATAQSRAPVVEEPTSGKVLRALGRAPIHVLLVVVGLLWLVPTFGLLITSLIAPEDFAQGGWWRVFSQPSLLTFENYQSIWDTQAIRDSLLTTVWISIGGTLLPILVAALAGYAFAWLDFPGRDWLFIAVVALLVVPLQMALIPIFTLYNKVGIFDTVISLILF